MHLPHQRNVRLHGRSECRRQDSAERDSQTDPRGGAGGSNAKRTQIIGIADPSIYDRSRRGIDRGNDGTRRNLLVPGDNTRLAGKMQYHYRLAFDSNGRAMFYVFDTCKDFIRTIPALVYDEHNVEDIDTTQEDHIYDECRYVLMEHPIAPRQSIVQEIPQEDPLDLYKQKRLVLRV